MQADPDAAGGGSGPETTANEPADMDSTIAALFDKMQEGGEATNEETDADSPAADEPAAKPASARDASGKFAKAATAPEDGDSGKGGKDPGTAVAAKPEEAAAAAPATQFAEAPKSWNATERAVWAKMPEEARTAAHRREEDFHRGIEQYRGKAATFDSLHAVISPHAEIFKASGQNAVENVGALLNLQQVLYTGNDEQKIGTLLQIVEQSGIKPEVLIQGLQNPQARPAQDPRYDSLARETQQLRQTLSELQVKPVQNEIEKFFGDPKNEFLAEPGLTDSMLSLITSGVAKTVQEAYDKACRLSDTVQAKVTAQKAEADRKAQAERDSAEAKRKADLAAKATRASSINVKPKGATAGPAAKGTMDDTIGSIYDRIHGSGN